MVEASAVREERGRTLVPKGGLLEGRPERIFYPQNESEAQALLGALAADGAPTVTCVGAERSFDGHFLPPKAAGRAVAVSSRELRSPPVILGEDEDSTGQRVLWVRVSAGMLLGELLDAVNLGAQEWMFFTCPTSEWISVGGAHAANCHSRTSSTYGGLFADHVRRFTLIDAAGRRHDCRADAPLAIDRTLFRMVPGSFGALGFVTELELALRRASPWQLVNTKVQHSRMAALETGVNTFARLTAENAGGRRFSEGVGFMLFGHPLHGLSTLFSGNTLDARERRPRSAIPLFEERPRRNAVLQGLSNRVPQLANTPARYLFREGREFLSNLRLWAFYQSSYDDAARVLARPGAGWDFARRVTQVQPLLRLVHQTWVLPRASLWPALKLHAELSDRAEFREVRAASESQDVIPSPATDWPLHPGRAYPDGSYAFSLSFSAHPKRKASAAAISDYCSRLTQLASERVEGMRVHLLKQLHCDDALLHRQYADELAQLRRVKSEIDPHGRFSSRVLERLLA
jgi:FAD/FMN-containing dehydrogenase